MHFLPEQIEILWLIPVIALVVFIFIIQFLAQKREKSAMSQEVARFNTGTLPNAQVPLNYGPDRLSQLEQAISSITDSLTVQQQTLNQVSKGSAGYSNEINDLKGKLRELYKEYDIVLSENYSLRAKVKKLEADAHPQGEGSDMTPDISRIPPTAHRDDIDMLLASKIDMKLYEDTRTLNLALLDDTSEIDINDLTKRKNS